MPAASTPSDGDVIFNRASVALARSQRLVASWLSPRTAEESAQAKSEQELEKEDQETFKPVPELLGVGAPLPEEIPDGSFKRSHLSSNDKLRKQLLGKNAVNRASGSQHTPSKHLTATRESSKPVKRPYTEDSEDEEEGRASSFKSRRARSNNVSPAPLRKPPAAQPKDEDVEDSNEDTKGDDLGVRPPKASSPTLSAKAKRPTSSFLDDVLEEKAKKKKKKKHKKDREAATAAT
ncbi:hypothetical protein H2201_001766 [Coniosporium apollinis]|uniref:DNA replication regulator SLD2 n=1 Tax=Coniosporium apollinis TaxID=61459 RepID=A0ABQ9P1V5_9PEZI|nr:hypothetical protein H2201_001766 [Coniosporium apollinis]